MITRRYFVSLLSSLPLIGMLFSSQKAREQCLQSDALPCLVPDARVNVFDWDKAIVFLVQGGYSGAKEYKMPSGKIELFDAETGEAVHRVLAYDAGRGLVTRVLEDGESDHTCSKECYMDATWNEIAKTTEKRRLFAGGDSVLAGCINSARRSWLH